MKMYRIVTIGGIMIALATLAGCEADRMSEKGFSLPEGNALDGQKAFVYLHCYECHTIEGVDLPPVTSDEQPYVQLGGKVSQVKTYGQLVTSIINPSHKLAPGYPLETIAEDGQSKMPVYNGFMTVQELIDIVSFLQPHYEVIVPKYYYRVYP
jgi:mono/diheme cytochrome c family protein